MPKLKSPRRAHKQQKKPRNRREPGKPIVLKSRREIEKMYRAGQVVAEAHAAVRELVHPGVTTGELDAAIEEVFRRYGATPLFLGVPCPEEGGPDFPAVTCTSTNQEVVRGTPDDRVLPEPSPSVVVTEMADSSVNMTLRFYIRDPSQEVPLRWEYTEKVRETLREADIEIPFPHRQLFLDEAKALQGTKLLAPTNGEDASTE